MEGQCYVADETHSTNRPQTHTAHVEERRFSAA